MRVWLSCVGCSLVTLAGVVFGCAAGADPNGSVGGSGGAGGVVTIGGSGSGLDSGVPDGFGECAKFSGEAKQAPAALLFVLDRSASMSQQGKWGTAQLAVVQAIDKDVFDTMSLGLSAFPSNFTAMPDCLCNYIGGPGICELVLPMGVACGYPTLPQIAIAPAGAEKSNAASGVRHDIYQYLVSKTPESADPSDASPIYDSLTGAYAALKAQQIDKRIAVLITDGGFSCTSLAIPTRPGYSDGACNDWEYPDSVNTLINSARLDPDKPINTFVVGVPGSNSHGEMQGSYATAPYSMRLALSTYAVNGSPDTVDPACDMGLVFTQGGADPAKPCHIDLSNGANFNPDTLSNAIETIRGKALGCLYDLPKPPPGQQIDPALVNVVVTLGSSTSVIPKRQSTSDDCAADGCWDYNATQQVQLLGKTCTDVSAASDAKVEIYVGCSTILK